MSAQANKDKITISEGILFLNCRDKFTFRVSLYSTVQIELLLGVSDNLVEI